MKQREIKFRALKDDMSNCNFVYGQLVYDAIGCPRITQVDSSGQGLTFHTCIRGTEGQYTGIKDKNGKEIYEGDIIHRHMNVYWEVRFTKDRWQAHPKHECGLWLDTDQFQEAEVIGNIHERYGLLAATPK